MQPRRRHQLLVHVDRHNTLPQGTTAAEVQALDGLIRGTYTDGRYQLTRQGAIAVVQSGPNAMRPRAVRSGTDAA